jgi:hypothetical protein
LKRKLMKHLSETTAAARGREPGLDYLPPPAPLQGAAHEKRRFDRQAKHEFKREWAGNGRECTEIGKTEA